MNTNFISKIHKTADIGSGFRWDNNNEINALVEIKTNVFIDQDNVFFEGSVGKNTNIGSNNHFYVNYDVAENIQIGNNNFIYNAEIGENNIIEKTKNGFFYNFFFFWRNNDKPIIKKTTKEI